MKHHVPGDWSIAASAKIAFLIAWAITAAPTRNAAGAKTVQTADREVSPLEIVADGEPAREANTALAADQILLISTRAVGTRCEPAALANGLRCEQLVRGASGAGHWQSLAWSDLAAELDRPLPTIIYVHGNRVECGVDKSHGMNLYRSLAARHDGAAPMRYVIWSWPSEQIRGPLKDYQVKAARTRPVGWQLAWAIDQLPEETPLALVGYSYGARVVTGALHLLAGGEMGDLKLTERRHPNRPPVRAALVAAAVDADWIRPRGPHGRALELVDQLLLVNNERDPAMRFYHLPMEGRHPRALGHSGPISGSLPVAVTARIRSIDATGAVGRRHALEDYLAASGSVSRALGQVVQLPPAQPLQELPPREAAIAGRENSGGHQ